VPCELLFAVYLKVSFAVIDDNGVVHRLADKVLAVRVHGRCRNGVHIGLADVLGDYRDAEFPHVDLLVVGSGDEASPVLDECDCIDRPQVLFILLHWFFLIDIVLHDLFVRTTSQKDVLLVVAWVELNALRVLLCLVIPDNLSCLGVPEVDALVEAGAQEFVSIVGEADVTNGFAVSHVGTDAPLVRHDVPDLAVAVVTGAEKKVACFRHEFDALHAPIMALPCVDPLFGYEAVVLLVAQVGRWINEALAPAGAELASVAVVDRSRLCFEGQWLRLLRLLDLLLPLGLVSVHQLLLFFGQLSLLRFEFFHTFVRCPRSLEFAGGRVSEFLPFHL